MEAYDHEIATVARWATSSSVSLERCCVLTSPPASGRTTQVPVLLYQALKQTCPEAKLVLITNKHDANRVSSLNRHEGSSAFSIYTYKQAIGVAATKALEDKTVLLIDEDPHWGTEFAVSLTLYLCRAGERGEGKAGEGQQSFPTRFVILAAHDDQRFHALATRFDLSTMHIGLPEPTATATSEIVYTVGNDTQAHDTILQSLLSASDGTKHAIVQFSPLTTKTILKTTMVNAHIEEMHLKYFDECIQDGGSAMIATDVPDGKRILCRIINCPVSYAPGIFVAGYDSVHIVTGATRVENVLDRETGLMTTIEIVNTAEEMREQESWVRRTDTAAANVFIYNRVPETTPSRRRRDLIDNEQLGGFLYMLELYYHLGFRPLGMGIAKILTKDTRACMELRARLTNSKVFSRDSEINVALCDGVFPQVLSCLGYRYELAVLATPELTSPLPLSGPIENMIKAQWAALLHAGIDKVFSFRDAASGELERHLSLHPRGCMTHTAGHGSLWLLLGIWKHAKMAHPEHFPLMTSGICNGLVQLAPEESKHALNTMKSLQAIYEHCRVPVHNVEEGIDTEPDKLSDYQTGKLNWALLQAFCYQMVVFKNDRAAASIRYLRGYLGIGMSQVEVDPGKLLYDTVDYPHVRSVQKPGCALMLGISFCFSTVDCSRNIFDFTWIREEIVAAWLEELTPEKNLFKVLQNEFVGSCANPDEVGQSISNAR